MTIGKVAKIVTRINPTSNNIIRWIKFYFIWSNSPRIREIYETENFSNLIAKRNQLLEENPPAKNVNSELKFPKLPLTACMTSVRKQNLAKTISDISQEWLQFITQELQEPLNQNFQ